MSSILYADEIASIEKTKRIGLNGIKITADKVKTNYVIRATSSTEANWQPFGANPAPASSEYFVLSSNPILVNQKILSIGAGLSSIDNGPKSTLDIDVSTTTTKTGRFYNPFLEIDSTGRIIDISSGRNIVAPVVVATTQPGNLNVDFSGSYIIIDDVIVYPGWEILIKDQVDPKENGVYVLNGFGAPIRRRDFEHFNNFNSPIEGYVVPVQQGTINGGCQFLCDAPSGTVIDTDPIIFRPIAGLVSRNKIITTNDIGEINNILRLRQASVAAKAGGHFDIQTETTDTNFGSSASVNDRDHISIDGKMCFLETKSIIFNNCNYLSIKNINLGRASLSIKNCNTVLVSNCIFTDNDFCLSILNSQNIIIKNCIFHGNYGIFYNNSALYLSGCSNAVIVGCQFHDYSNSNNYTSSNLIETGSSGVIISGNSFVDGGSSIISRSNATLITHNNISEPKNNPEADHEDGGYDVGDFKVGFGYIQIEARDTIVNSNNISLNLTSCSLNLSGILIRNIGNCVGNNNFTGPDNVGVSTTCIGIESDSANNLMTGNSCVIQSVLTNSVDYPISLISMGPNCGHGLVGRNLYFFRTSGKLSNNTFKCVSLATTGNTYIALIRGNVSLYQDDLFSSDTIASNCFIDYYEFNYSRSYQYTDNYKSTPPLGAHGYTVVIKRTEISGPGRDTVFYTISNIQSPNLGAVFAPSADRSITLFWTGNTWKILGTQGTTLF